MLPNKKILIILALVIIGVGALGIYVYTKGSATTYENANETNALAVSTSSDSTNTISQVDSDHDGLADWEEVLYGTDPHNPDTDGDGTSDGAEVAAGRNPLVKGPNDYINKTDTAKNDNTPEKLTLTDSFARDFFQKYVAIQQSGTKITADNADQVASDYLKSATLPTITAKQYASGDLNLINSSKADLNNYKDSITAVFNKYWPAGQTSEISILQDAFSNSNASALTKLSPLITAYQSLLQGSLTVAVPKLAVSLHINVVNSLSNYIQTLKMIQSAYSDPIGGLVGLNAYQNNQANLLISLSNLKVFLINSLK